MMESSAKSIGIFDSGYGGLTVFREIRALLPQYDYVYLGDNARTPYGTRSFDVVYQYTWECTRELFAMGCELVILACNTASAKALRSIQQNQLPQFAPERRVLGVIRPTVEQVGGLTQTRHIGIFGTEGTIQSESYPLEIHKLFPDIQVSGQVCPLWVPLVENGESQSDGADYFVKKYCEALLSQDAHIDLVILACTHYPLLIEKIRKYLPSHVKLLTQGPLVASSLQNYLQRHPEMDERLHKSGQCRLYTTESTKKFAYTASRFLDEEVQTLTQHVSLHL